MDLETENRLAAMLMREAAELRRQSEQEGVLAYLRKPNVRTRPNSRFLTATVRGVQQGYFLVTNFRWSLVIIALDYFMFWDCSFKEV